MLTINVQNDKLATAQIDFTSRGMLQGTCLGEALKLWRDNDSTSDDDNNNNNNNNNQFNGPDGNGEDGSDLDIDYDDEEDDGAPGPADGPLILSEVVLTQRKGIECFVVFHKFS